MFVRRRQGQDELTGGFDVSLLEFNILDDEFNEFATVQSAIQKLVRKLNPRFPYFTSYRGVTT